MQDFCHAARYIRMSSNPTGGLFIKFFQHSLFGDIIFMSFFIIFCVLFNICFDFVCFCYCIVLYFFNIMKFQGASCPSIAVGVLSSSVEPPSQSLAVSVSFLNVR